MIQVVYPGSESRFRDPGVKKAPDQVRIGFRNTGNNSIFETAALMYLYQYT
jgi:hypothetical protein